MAIFVTVIHSMNMETDPILHLMEHHGVKPTANRILIAKALAGAGRPMSPGELEDALETIDKSVISRALSLFREQHLVHVIEDGDSLRYELCHSHHEDHDDDAHVHFHCQVCGRTFCLENTPIPEVAVPEGFRSETANFLIKGTCPDCNR